MADPRVDVVLAMFAAYRAGDRPAAEALLGPTLTFTSPQDDHIDRAAYLERCFPTASRFRTQSVLATAAADDAVFLLYEYELADGGARYRNAEVITVRDGLIVEIQVFFGGAALIGTN